MLSKPTLNKLHNCNVLIYEIQFCMTTALLLQIRTIAEVESLAAFVGKQGLVLLEIVVGKVGARTLSEGSIVQLVLLQPETHDAFGQAELARRLGDVAL